MSEYEHVQKSSLKLKGGDGGIKKKKKKDKKKSLEKRLQQISMGTDSGGEQPGTSYRDKRTKAELAFERVKNKRDAEQILEKASQTHKERILGFNKHLDSMSEHFDIPKVSWTK